MQSLLSIQLVAPCCPTQRSVLFSPHGAWQAQPNSRAAHRVWASTQSASPEPGTVPACSEQLTGSKQTREIGCSELYNMTEVINAQTAINAEKPPSTMDAGQSTTTDVQQPAQHSQDGMHNQQGLDGSAKGAEYYAGLLMTDVRVDNKASGADMLQRSLQLAGGVGVVLVLLTYLFLASNQLL